MEIYRFAWRLHFVTNPVFVAVHSANFQVIPCFYKSTPNFNQFAYDNYKSIDKSLNP